MPKVKICGITNTEDAIAAIQLGAIALGFIFVSTSPRYIPKENCKKITNNKELKQTELFGVFQDHVIEDVSSIMDECSLSVIQLHGQENRKYIQKLKEKTQLPIVKAYRLNEDGSNLNTVIESAQQIQDLVKYFLLDGPGGGKTISKESIQKFKDSINKPMILAGGLSPNNIEEIIRSVEPKFIDACSGLEKSKGKKDIELMKDFFKKLKK